MRRTIIMPKMYTAPNTYHFMEHAFQQHTSMAIDINGNGKVDLLITQDDSTKIYEWNCELQKMQLVLTSDGGRVRNFPTDLHLCYYGDFNGDGIQDILTYATDHHWRININNGIPYCTTSVDITSLLQAIPNWKTDQYNSKDCHHPLVADFNGDGKVDIAQIQDNVWHIFFTRYINANNQYAYTEKILDSVPYDESILVFKLGDVNNDGKIDIIYKIKHAWCFFRNESADLIAKITNGLSVETELEYTQYVKGNAYVQGKIHLPLVKTLKQSNGSGNGKNTTTFEYINPVFNYQRHCFQGFNYFYCHSNGITKEYTFFKNNTFQILEPDKIRTYKTSDKNGDEPFEVQTFMPEVFTFGSNAIFLPYNRYHITNDVLNHRFFYTERILYESRIAFGREQFNISGVKTFEQSEVWSPYAVKTTTKTTYQKYYNKYIKPDSVIITEERAGEILVKKQYKKISYQADGIYLSQIRKWNEYGSQLQTFSLYNNAGIPLWNVFTATNAVTVYKSTQMDSTFRFITREVNMYNLFQNNFHIDTIGTYTYNTKTGNLLTSTDRNGFTTTYHYDKFGQKTATFYPDGSWDSVYVGWGNPITTVANSAYYTCTMSSFGAMGYTVYDKLGRKIFTYSQSDGCSEIRYNSVGQVVKVSFPYLYNTIEADKKWTTYAYDLLGRVIREKSPTTNICYKYGILCDTAYESKRD
ncbi:MAG: FG-GAP-like repeat-containing protein, partial [Bacteroidales bacterium]|nr:FG-GAP-like repeat-containing protein [Bacteroidales bacterium]